MCAAECRKRKKSKMFYAGGSDKKKYADKLYGPEMQGSGDHKVVTTGEDLDVDAAISQELESLKKKPSRRRFQALDSGAKNVVFIQCEDVVCPNELVHFMLTDIAATRVPCTRHCQRMLPITHVCKAFQVDIIKCATEMLAPHFHISGTTLKFAVVYKARNNNDVIRDNVILWIAQVVNKDDTYTHKVDLTSPDLVILVEIIKSHCCMSVVKDFHNLKKYNIQELITVNPDQVASASGSASKEPVLESNSSQQDEINE
ncbi:THUMP domain-containing protein 1-like isoform X2 [Dysidea avara]|uniref:THUMP domain-containing protein 1-like isoform X2 n=1 Tax=Dysidea avara TaxID=196820 RepID=UPI003327C134